MKKFVFKRSKKVVFKVVFLLVFISLSSLFIYKNFNKKDIDIDKILRSESYSYLPKEAKNYIEDVYKETGEIILTEKNKEVNKPYLNPQYVAYLQLSDEKRANVSLLPNPYSVDYLFASTSASYSQEYPKTYNLENIDGKNYTSPMYDQGNLGTCWAFAIVENAESHLMIKKNEPRNANSTRFSVRQLDYAASTDGIKGYENPWGAAPLGLGGNFIYATTLMANGLSLVDDDYMPYVETLNEKPLYEIHNYSNSLYEVNSTVNLSRLGRLEMDFTKECNYSDDIESCFAEKNEEMFQEYINIIKNGIMNYGGIFAGAYDPTGVCGALNTDGYYVLDPNLTCFPMGSTAPAETGHAMQIIGWNDDYKYSYCRGSTHSSTVDGACVSGVLTEGTGAWLVKNSWGENDSAAYIYLTYDSILAGYVEFAYITSLTEMKDRNWDNVYNNGKIAYSFHRELTQTFKKKHDNEEKIQKIKFHTILMNKQYSISVKIDGNTYLITDSYQTKYPGLYTVDVSDKNIFIESGNFDVIIIGSDNSINGNSISVFTKNVDSEQLIITEEEKDIDSNNFTIYSETRNIPSNSQIMYELYDDSEKLENVMQVNNNIVAANNINAEISLIKKLEPGTYTLVQKIGDIEATTSLNIGTILDGAGTEENPFKIYTEEDLKYIHTHLDSYYKLENDIELTSEWVPIGTEENPFTGAFDGNNHKIINLQIDDSTLEYAGLFGYVKDSDEHQTYIKNIYLVNPNIVADYYAGGLIGYIYITQTGTKSTLIDSIYIIGGNIEGKQASGLVANIFGTFNKDLTINNIFSSATIKGKITSSLIGMYLLGDDTGNNKGVSISNIQNIGVMYDNGVTSLINANSSVNAYSLSNYISTGYSKKVNWVNQSFYDTPVHDIDDVEETKGYVLARSDSTYTFPSIIMKVTDITELKNTSKYSDWGDDFNTYWEVKEEDGVTRIPTLKGVDLDYTESIDDINVEFGNDIALSDYISSELITRRLNVTTEDNDIIEISKEYNPSEAYPHEIIISPLKQGTATIHVVSDYDGYEDDVTINVSKTNLTITYHNGTETSIQNVTNGTAVNLIKNTFKKEHHIFKEWNTKADGTGIPYSDEQEVTITEDLDLYTIWEENTYKISFDANGGTGTMEDIVSNAGEAVILTENAFTKEGYHFGHWNTKSDDSGESYYNIKEVSPTIDLKLYAIWYPNEYTIKWYNEDGSKSKLSYNVEYDKEYAFTDYKWTLPEGYLFKEWNTKMDGTGDGYKVGEKFKNLTAENNGVIVFYAILSPISYKVIFNSNSGTGTMPTQTFIYDETQELNENTFIRNGYAFKNWNTKADGTGISYTNEQEISISEDFTLYAQWNLVIPEINKYKLKDNMITNLKEGLNANEFDLQLDEIYTLKIYDKSENEKTEGSIATGDKAKIYLDNLLVSEYTLVVSGDVTGDGIVNIADVLKIADHTINKNILTDYEELAAEVTNDTNLNIADVLKIADYTLDKRIELIN